MNIKHQAYKDLVRIKAIDPGTLELFSNSVRDSELVKVFRCLKSGVIFLDRILTSNSKYYSGQSNFDYWNNATLLTSDDNRRASNFKSHFTGKHWLDFGCGAGGLLKLASEYSASACGIELQPEPRKALNEVSIPCFENLDQVENDSLDLITLFHVFEHLDNPSQLLKLCFNKLKKYGSIIIEVPHAKDALLTTYNSDSFRKFTLWSEHIVLHTNESLKLFLDDASFKLDRIEGFQRYPLSNHLYWLAYNKPGGHEIWNHLNSVDIENAYSNALKCNNSTDTIIAFATKS